MPDEAQEDWIAERVERMLALEGYELSPRVRHDAAPGQMRVDYVYKHARPRPLVLEVTSLQRGGDLATAKAAVAFEARLNATASDEALGHWHVAVSMDSNLNQLYDEVVALMRAGFEVRPGTYTAEEIPPRTRSRKRQEFYRFHAVLQELGLVELHRSVGSGDRVKVLPIGRATKFGGFAELLASTIAANAQKLAEARPNETHLAIEVIRWDLSTEPRLTAVPSLPPSLDRLWVFHHWAGRLGDPAVWSVVRGAEQWTLYEAGP